MEMEVVIQEVMAVESAESRDTGLESAQTNQQEVVAATVQVAGHVEKTATLPGSAQTNKKRSASGAARPDTGLQTARKKIHEILTRRDQ